MQNGAGRVEETLDGGFLLSAGPSRVQTDRRGSGISPVRPMDDLQTKAKCTKGDVCISWFQAKFIVLQKVI
jgi:hypothetical protein